MSQLVLCAVLLAILCAESLSLATTKPTFTDSLPVDVTRRDVLWQTPLLIAAVAPFLASDPVRAADEKKTLGLQDLLSGLRSVPTFCIVNPDGATYMLFKGQNYAKGYAFTTFQGALAVLGDAQRTAKQKGYSEVWEKATITIIPADIAVRLALQPKERKTQKDTMLTGILEVVPSVDDREDAIQMDGRFKDQAKVPLFYFATSESPTRLFFKKEDLVQDWKAAQPDAKTTPPIKVMDLISIFEYVLRGRAAELPFFC